MLSLLVTTVKALVNMHKYWYCAFPIGDRVDIFTVTYIDVSNFLAYFVLFISSFYEVDFKYIKAPFKAAFLFFTEFEQNWVGLYS